MTVLLLSKWSNEGVSVALARDLGAKPAAERPAAAQRLRTLERSRFRAPAPRDPWHLPDGARGSTVDRVSRARRHGTLRVAGDARYDLEGLACAPARLLRRRIRAASCLGTCG